MEELHVSGGTEDLRGVRTVFQVQHAAPQLLWTPEACLGGTLQGDPLEDAGGQRRCGFHPLMGRLPVSSLHISQFPLNLVSVGGALEQGWRSEVSTDHKGVYGVSDRTCLFKNKELQGFDWFLKLFRFCQTFWWSFPLSFSISLLYCFICFFAFALIIRKIIMGCYAYWLSHGMLVSFPDDARCMWLVHTICKYHSFL